VKTPASRRTQRASEAWRLMFDFLMRSAPQRLASQQRRGLTPNDTRALFALDRDGTPIGMLARQMGCDASTATWLVDRLERAGLAQRTASPDDRRVKLVRLTDVGAATAGELMAEYREPPPELTALASTDLDDLVRLLRKLVAEGVSDSLSS